MKKMPFRALLNTGGGLWSEGGRKVQVVALSLGENIFDESSLFDDEEGFDPNALHSAELRVYFTTRSWDVERHGLIYTDDLFEKELKKRLRAAGWSAKAVRDIDYSEQGMQGDDYVSFDCGADFLMDPQSLPLIPTVISRHWR